MFQRSLKVALKEYRTGNSITLRAYLKARRSHRAG